MADWIEDLWILIINFVLKYVIFLLIPEMTAMGAQIETLASRKEQ